jgi:hypothetical protein
VKPLTAVWCVVAGILAVLATDVATLVQRLQRRVVAMHTPSALPDDRIHPDRWFWYGFAIGAVPGALIALSGWLLFTQVG